jgi:hypothetical protein
MIWRDEWSAIAGRIEGLLGAGDFLIRALGINSEDPYNVKDRHLGAEARAITANLRTFLKIHGCNIPGDAAVAVQTFLDKYGNAIDDQSVNGLEGLKLRLTSLAALRAAVTYHLSDFEAVAHRKAERAFLHLQQTLVADETVREKWAKAFDLGETACEKLGATHLMLHGICAFKVNAEGARTDLVFGEPLDSIEEIGRAADALLLTEWKLVKDHKDSESIAKAAREQTKQYAVGVLGGLELSQHRYIVLVSRQQLTELKDLQDGPIRYRHVNVSVQPQSPSRAARRRSAE